MDKCNDKSGQKLAKFSRKLEILFTGLVKSSSLNSIYLI